MARHIVDALLDVILMNGMQTTTGQRKYEFAKWGEVFLLVLHVVGLASFVRCDVGDADKAEAHAFTGDNDLGGVESSAKVNAKKTL